MAEGVCLPLTRLAVVPRGGEGATGGLLPPATIGRDEPDPTGSLVVVVLVVVVPGSRGSEVPDDVDILPPRALGCTTDLAVLLLPAAPPPPIPPTPPTPLPLPPPAVP
jgi:hypothetical protein